MSVAVQGGHTFSKEERLLKRGEFLSVTEHGRKRHTASFIVFDKNNNRRFSRLGITVSRKVGSAVCRNRIKRLIREFFRLRKADIKKGCDIVIIAKKGAAEKGYHDLVRELGPALFISTEKAPA